MFWGCEAIFLQFRGVAATPWHLIVHGIKRRTQGVSWSDQWSVTSRQRPFKAFLPIASRITHHYLKKELSHGTY
jgi:hypothetical protein